MKKTVSAIMLTLLLISMLTLAFSSSISLVRALWVWELPIPYVTRASEVTVDGEIAEEGWNYATHFHSYSTHKKTIEFDVFLMHDGMSLYIASKIYNNDFWGSGWLSDSFEVEINDRNDGHYGGDSGNDVKRILVTPTGLGIYKDKWIPSDERQDTKVDGEGAFTFSGIRQDGEIGDYYFELRIPIDGDPPEDAKLREGTPFGMMISFIDYDPAENVGFGYWLLQGSFVLEAGPPTVYIRADGSIDPPDAPISTVDCVTYTLTGNIYSGAYGIVVQRSNIIIDGAGYTVEGTGVVDSKGISLSELTNVTIKNTNIKRFYYCISFFRSSSSNIQVNNITNNGWLSGIWLEYSSNNSISGNNIANNWDGISLSHSSNNSISGNNITNNDRGIKLSYSDNNSIPGNNIANNGDGIELELSSGNSVSGNNITANNNYGIYLYYLHSSDNIIYHNNFINNVYDQVYSGVSVNVWDDGYPSGGNYWSDYAGVDVKSGLNQDLPESDGIGDAPYIIDANNTDHYPLMNPYGAPPPPTYTLTITATVGGTTDPLLGTYSYTANSTVQATAIPAANYLFEYWDLDGVNVGSANPYSVLMNKNHTLKAIFSHIKPSVPVGGYSFPIQAQTKTEPIIPYIALIATLTAVFTKLRPKTKRKR
jgi:parallel beta-helix repeat protein